jgi:hypothetical protein
MTHDVYKNREIMTKYEPYGLSLRESQKKSIGKAIQRKTGLSLKLTRAQLHGNDRLALTKVQIGHIMKNSLARRGADIKMSKAQLQAMKKMGGFLPLIPLILAGLSAVGGLAGGAAGIAKAVNDKRSSDAAMAEQVRHNKEIESQLRGSGLTCCPTCRGSGLYLQTTKRGTGVDLGRKKD